MRVQLIDDHALFRLGLRELLERRGIAVIAAEGDSDEGIELACRERPDVVLLDLRMPRLSGLEVLRRLREKKCIMPVVILTTSREERDLVEALRGGAQGYLLKDMEPEDLIHALSDVVEGQVVVARELTGVLARVVRRDDASSVERDPEVADLTPREREILCLLAEGQSNKVIAKNLSISEGTVKLHVKAILRKLVVHSRVEAAVIAVERNLCSRSGDSE